MTYRAKLSLINFGIWTVMFIITSISFFTSTYPEVLPLSNYRTTTAVLFVIPNIANVILLVLKTKKEKTDEFNRRVEAASAGATMIIIMILFFLGALSLHVIYEDTGLVPSQWLWFLAYGSVFMVFIVFNLCYVIVSLKGFSYENQ